MKKWITLVLCLLFGALFLTGCSERGEGFQTKNYTADGAQIKGIRVDVKGREITVSPSDDGQIHIDYFESEKEFYDLSVSDQQILTMTAASDKSWTDYIGVKSAAGTDSIALRIPDALLSTLELSTTDGDITLTPLSVTEGVALSSNGGTLRFDGLNAGQNLTLKVKNGDIDGTIAGSYEDYTIACDWKKGESNLPAEKSDGVKTLTVSANNGDISVGFEKR